MTPDRVGHFLDSTLSHSSLPAVKRGTRFAGAGTVSGVFDWRPFLGGLWASVKRPKRRISIRSPRSSVSLIPSRIALTEGSASLPVSRGKCVASRAMSSERVTPTFYPVRWQVRAKCHHSLNRQLPKRMPCDELNATDSVLPRPNLRLILQLGTSQNP